MPDLKYGIQNKHTTLKNSTIKKSNKLKNEWRSKQTIHQKIYKSQKSICKDTSHHISLENQNSNEKPVHTY